jgi:methylated-DNA-[protein]-cysteine S-methyltransferase
MLNDCHSLIVKVSGRALRVFTVLEDGIITRIELALEESAEKYPVDSAPVLRWIFQHILDGMILPEAVDYQVSGTEFQKRVWAAAGSVPYGSTVTYGEIARVIGCGSARAVGQALGANPVPILIPCHRIVGAGGKLTGFSSGLAIKSILLRHEHENSSRQ